MVLPLPKECFLPQGEIMKITTTKLLNSKDALRRLNDLDGLGENKRMVKGWSPFAYRVAKALQTIQNELDIYQKAIAKLFQTFATDLNEKGEPIVPSDKIEEANKQAQELADVEVELQGVEKITVPKDLPGLKIGDMVALDWLLTFEE